MYDFFWLFTDHLKRMLSIVYLGMCVYIYIYDSAKPHSHTHPHPHSTPTQPPHAHPIPTNRQKKTAPLPLIFFSSALYFLLKKTAPSLYPFFRPLSVPYSFFLVFFLSCYFLRWPVDKKITSLSIHE